MLNVPPTDVRCADPAFAEKYPSACRFFTRLILKNEYSRYIAAKSVTFKAFASANGVESRLTSGVVFSSSNTAVATINASSGVATTVAAGKTTISALWNNQYAYAELEVVSACTGAGNYFVLIDNSFSMQQNFDGVYPTKLAYAKYLSSRFFSSMNATKDQMAFGNFNVEADVNQEFTNSIATLNASWPILPTVQQMTDLRDAIEHGVEYLNETVTSGIKVMVLITDGQYNKGGLPGPIAREFKQSGGIIIVVGVRVFDVYYQLLNEISTKGYFLSAYGSIATAVGTNLIGLKSFLCSGDCPSGAVYGCLTEPLDTQIADPDPLQVQSEY